MDTRVAGAAFNTGAREARLALRRQWLADNRAVIRDLLGLCAAVDRVDPAISLGLMTANALQRMDYPAWTARLPANGRNRESGGRAADFTRMTSHWLRWRKRIPGGTADGPAAG